MLSVPQAGVVYLAGLPPIRTYKLCQCASVGSVATLRGSSSGCTRSPGAGARTGPIRSGLLT